MPACPSLLWAPASCPKRSLERQPRQRRPPPHPATSATAFSVPCPGELQKWWGGVCIICTIVRASSKIISCHNPSQIIKARWALDLQRRAGASRAVHRGLEHHGGLRGLQEVHQWHHQQQQAQPDHQTCPSAPQDPFRLHVQHQFFQLQTVWTDYQRGLGSVTVWSFLSKLSCLYCSHPLWTCQTEISLLCERRFVTYDSTATFVSFVTYLRYLFVSI